MQYNIQNNPQKLLWTITNRFIISACLFRYHRRHPETDPCWLQPAGRSAREAGVRWPWLLSGQPCRQWVWRFPLRCSNLTHWLKKFTDWQLTDIPEWILFYRSRHWERHNEKVSDGSALCGSAKPSLLHRNSSSFVLSGQLWAAANIECLNLQWHPLEPARGEEDDRWHQLAAQSGADHDLEPRLNGDACALSTSWFVLLLYSCLFFTAEYSWWI